MKKKPTKKVQKMRTSDANVIDMKKEMNHIKSTCIYLLIMGLVMFAGSSVYMVTYDSDASKKYSTMITAVDKMDDINQLRGLLKSELTETRSYDHLVRQMMWMLVLFGGVISIFVSVVLHRLGKVNRFIHLHKKTKQ